MKIFEAESYLQETENDDYDGYTLNDLIRNIQSQKRSDNRRFSSMAEESPFFDENFKERLGSNFEAFQNYINEDPDRKEFNSSDPERQKEILDEVIRDFGLQKSLAELFPSMFEKEEEAAPTVETPIHRKEIAKEEPISAPSPVVGASMQASTGLFDYVVRPVIAVSAPAGMWAAEYFLSAVGIMGSLIYKWGWGVRLDILNVLVGMIGVGVLSAAFSPSLLALITSLVHTFSSSLPGYVNGMLFLTVLAFLYLCPPKDTMTKLLGELPGQIISLFSDVTGTATEKVEQLQNQMLGSVQSLHSNVGDALEEIKTRAQNLEADNALLNSYGGVWQTTRDQRPGSHTGYGVLDRVDDEGDHRHRGDAACGAGQARA